MEVLLIVHMRKEQPTNDIGGEILFKREGDRKKLLIMKVNDAFDPTAEWGPQLIAIRQRYSSALSIDKGVEVKIL